MGIVAWLVGPGDGLQLDPVDLAEVTDSGPSHGDAYVVAEMELLVEVGFPPLQVFVSNGQLHQVPGAFLVPLLPEFDTKGLEGCRCH